MKYPFIAAEQAHYSLSLLGRCMGVSRSGFHAWQGRPASRRATRDARVKVLVRTSFTRSRQRHAQPVAPNLLDQRFTADAPNQRWVADTTECVLAGGQKVHLAVVLDVFSRFVVGWALGPANDRFLTLRALERALQRRQPGTGLLHYSDRGSTYASHDYRALLTAHGITGRMSRTGNCYDHAVADAFFSTLKTELTDHFTSLSDATHQLFGYIDVFYNHQRRHSTIGYVSPAACERAFARAATDDGVALGGTSIPASALMGTPPSACTRASNIDKREVH